MMEIINKNKLIKLNIEEKILYMIIIRMLIITAQMWQITLHIKTIPLMLSGFVIIILSVINIIFVEEAYSQKRYTKHYRYIMQIANLIIIFFMIFFMIWITGKEIVI